MLVLHTIKIIFLARNIIKENHKALIRQQHEKVIAKRLLLVKSSQTFP